MSFILSFVRSSFISFWSSVDFEHTEKVSIYHIQVQHNLKLQLLTFFSIFIPFSWTEIRRLYNNVLKTKFKNALSTFVRGSTFTSTRIVCRALDGKRARKLRAILPGGEKGLKEVETEVMYRVFSAMMEGEQVAADYTGISFVAERRRVNLSAILAVCFKDVLLVKQT